MRQLQCFGQSELRAVERAREVAVELIGGFYALAPREWERMRYEVRTLEQLAPEEICDQAFAQVLCYDYVKRGGSGAVDQHDLYRICLQDHRILRVAERGGAQAGPAKLDLESLLLYVLTHELVHIVRFSHRLQSHDLAPEMRPLEEMSVERTTKQILAPIADSALHRVLATCIACQPEER